MSLVATDFDVAAAVAMPRGCRADAVTSDGHVFALWPQGDGRLRVVWDGEPGAPFQDLWALRDKSPAIFPSADGAHIAYMALRDGRQFVGRDGGEDPPFDSLTRSVPPVFSADGAHLAYGAGGGEDFRLVLDGLVVSELLVAPIQAVFSPDGSRLAYVELRPIAKGYEVRVVLDGVPGAWFEGMRNEGGVMQFSPDGSRFAYRESFRGGEVRWTVDGVAQQRTDAVLSLGQALHRVAVVEGSIPATFSPDGRRFAYFGDVKGKGVAIVEEDAPGPVVKAVYPPVFSPDSRHLGYLAQQFDGRLALVMDGVAGAPWSAKDGRGPWFSPDGRRVAVFLVREEGGLLRRRTVHALAIDGRTVAEVDADDASAMPVFSPDGGHFAWWYQRGKVARAMVDDQPVAPDVSIESNPVYSPSGRLLFAARTASGALTVANDGRPGPLAADIAAPQDALRLFANAPSVPFAVSPDGEHVAWMGVFDGDVRPVLDDRVGPAFDRPLGCSFDASGRATWTLQRADVVYRVTAAP